MSQNESGALSIHALVHGRVFPIIALGFLVMAILFVSLGFVSQKNALHNDAEAYSGLLADQLAPPLLRSDKEGALKTMALAKAFAELEAIEVRDLDGQVFTRMRDAERVLAWLGDGSAAHFADRFVHLQIARQVTLGGEKVGSLSLVISLEKLYLWTAGVILALFLLWGLLLLFVRSSLKRSAMGLAEPLAELSAMLDTVVRTDDLSYRAGEQGPGEISGLIRRVNELLELFQCKTRDLNSELQQRMLVEARLDNLAHYDPVTGLANRIQFHNELPRAAERAKRQGKNIALVFLDLDDFKVVNDTLGHDIGDRLLYSVGRRLTETIRQGDLICRLGGDEFTVILEGITSLRIAVDVVSKMIKSVGEVYDIFGHAVHIKVTAGIALFPSQTDDIRDLLRFADLAMYQAKSDGKNDYCVYTSNLLSRANERLVIESELRQGIDNDEFFLVYQPQVSLSSGLIEGMEALVRWQHPRRGLLSPGAFIDVAEKSGLIVPLGQRILELACQQWLDWAKQGLEPPKLAVNVSGLQLEEENFAEKLVAAMTAGGDIRPQLELEITESLLLSETRVSKAMMHRLAASGIEWSLDDFGTGYSSLTYLARFPIKNIKIDRSFISRLPGDKSSEAIVRAIIAMAQGLGLRVITEGVETRQQAEYLAAQGEIIAQGYYFHRPMAVDEVTLVLREELGRKIPSGPLLPDLELPI